MWENHQLSSRALWRASPLSTCCHIDDPQHPIYAVWQLVASLLSMKQSSFYKGSRSVLAGSPDSSAPSPMDLKAMITSWGPLQVFFFSPLFLVLLMFLSHTVSVVTKSCGLAHLKHPSLWVFLNLRNNLVLVHLLILFSSLSLHRVLDHLARF